MSNVLPAGCEFVDEVAIGTDELLDLFEDSIRGNEPLDDTNAVVTRREPFVDITATEEDIRRIALGVRDPFDKLIAYAAATIDERGDSHATVDYMVVSQAETDQGIGKALASEGLGLLDNSGVRTVSFDVFGQVQKLVPYLMSAQGFTYDPLNQEYISNRHLIHRNELLVDPDTTVTPLPVPEDETLQQAINADEIIIFKSAVQHLVEATARYARSSNIHVLLNNSFRFELAGRTLEVTQETFDDCTFWQVTEHGCTELVASPHGVVMATERQYVVSQYIDKDQPNQPEYSEDQEIRGADGAMRPFVPPEVRPGGSGLSFTKARYQRVMNTLRRLSPEHLVPDLELDD